MDSTPVNTILLNNTESQKPAFSGKASIFEIANKANKAKFNELNHETFTLFKLPDKIKINIFKNFRSPMNLLLTSKFWHQLSQQ
ncbi:2447_t:CDS:1, partial [Racocetra fulgida]